MAQHVDGRGLGRWAILDPKNLDHEAPVKTLVSKQDVQWDGAGQPVLNQDKVGGCTGFTIADILNTPRFARCRRRLLRTGYLGNSDGLAFYHDATVLDGFKGTYPPVDTGSTGTAAAKGAQKRGFWDGYGHTFSFEAFLANLQRQPLMVGTLWTRGMSDPDGKGVIEPTGDIDGGHEWMACRIDWARNLVGGLNHWTPEWGVKGRFWIPIPQMQWLLSQQGDVVVPHPV